MKARGSAQGQVNKNHDDPDKEKGQDKNQVEKKDSPTAAALEEDQEKDVDDHQGEIGDAIRSEGIEQQHLTIHVAQGQINRIGPLNDLTATSPPTQLEVVSVTAEEESDIAKLHENVATIQVRIEENRVKIAEMVEEFGGEFWELSNRKSRPVFWGSPKRCWRDERDKHKRLCGERSKLAELQSKLETQLQKRGIALQTTQGPRRSGRNIKKRELEERREVAAKELEKELRWMTKVFGKEAQKREAKQRAVVGLMKETLQDEQVCTEAFETLMTQGMSTFSAYKQRAVVGLMEETLQDEQVCTEALETLMTQGMSTVSAFILARKRLKENAGTGSAPGADAGAGEPAAEAAEEPEDPIRDTLDARLSIINNMLLEVTDEGVEIEGSGISEAGLCRPEDPNKLSRRGEKFLQTRATTEALEEVQRALKAQLKSHKNNEKKEKKRKLKKEGAANAVGTDTNNGAGTSAEARVPNPLIKTAGSKIYISREALAAHRGTDTDGGTDAGTGAGSMETEAQELMGHQEEKRKKVRLMGTDLYMAIMQALDMTLASGQAKKVEEADEAKEAQKAQESVIASGTADAPETDRQMRARQRFTRKRKQDEEDEKKKAKKKKEDENKAGPSNWRRSGDGPGSGRWGDMTTGEEQVVTDLVTEEEQMVRDLCNITGCTEEQCAEALATHSSENRSREEIWSFAYDMLKLIL